LELPPTIVAIHLGNAMVLLALLTIVAVGAYAPARSTPHAPRTTLRWALWTALGTYLLIISGALVLGTGAAGTCLDWPLCNGQVAPSGTLPQIHMGHRYVAAIVGIAIAMTLAQAWRSGIPALRTWGIVTAAVFAMQVVVGAANVLLRFPPVIDALHLLLAAGVWAGLIVIATVSFLTTANAENVEGREMTLRPQRSLR
jgi:heme A synthase